jgi:4'-phosphopantetheinyl transferase
MIGQVNDSVTISEFKELRSLWRTATDNFELNDDDADVWRLLLPLETRETLPLERILSSDERCRAARFRFAADKNHFVAARANLRILLGKYLRTDPRRIVFDYNKYGKPALGAEARATNLKFNVSHSGGVALLAFARREIGVDIERLNASFADEATAREFLTRAENERFLTLAETERAQFFFDCWTRKEALVKACGKGLSLAPNRLEVAVFKDFPAALPQTGTESAPSLWSLSALPAISGFAAALAIEGDRPHLRCRQTASADWFA